MRGAVSSVPLSVPNVESITVTATNATPGAPISRSATSAATSLLARISSTGVDMAAALAHGRARGAELRALTFHQRAALLKALASHLMEHREELYALSHRTGATRGDNTFDVDGGIGTLFSYASKGRRELPNDTVHVEGNVEPLGRGELAGRGRFDRVGQHLRELRDVPLVARLLRHVVDLLARPAGSRVEPG